MLKYILKKHVKTFGTLLWKSVILARDALLLCDIAGIGSAPQLMTFRLLHRYNKVPHCGAFLLLL